MPKKNKTRKQKMLTDQRRNLTHSLSPSHESVQQPVRDSNKPSESSESQGNVFTLPKSYTEKSTKTAQENTIPNQTNIQTHSYNYLSRDLFKTVFLTISIVLAELIIHFVLERG